MTELIAPTGRLHYSWLTAHDEWPPGTHQDGAGLRLVADDDLNSPEGFASWVERLRQQSDRSLPLGEGRVHATHWWIVDGETYLGAIDLRHYLNGVLLEGGGHIGYSIRPSARRQGLATWALGAVLLKASALGLDRVLLTCDDGNAGSARTIENNGGVLEDVRSTEIGVKRRYWIALDDAGHSHSLMAATRTVAS
ncbi:GNAT family N-acetyltransferase [Nonomuraea sp. NEAU-A123]|uniref:GNAT family N-acetyltransferase n=1 Tax=Nonomuraea sp. NEAU-A123 TaxID=2839649 RepID=UPI001BE4A7D2|nr:GNAT family N-acetyltransferase [Nonomuraea sp. NEAU-A123]MBT2231643.1 GNAT family N-acetyltransferase [Nonomuraea sp. NEAU-A123]